MTERVLIVGGDAAGMSAATAARRREEALEVLVLERGPYTSYSACGIPYYLGGVVEDSDRLIARSPEEFRSAGIDVRTRCEAVGLDLPARTVTVRDHAARREWSEGFDRLVVATGAEAVAPPVPGADAVEPVRTIDAAERFASRLDRESAGAAVVIGASYLGLEMAEALVQRGLEVTLVDQADQVMGTLDADMAQHVQQAAEGVGVKVLLSCEVQEIRVDHRRAGGSVLTSEGELPADEVVLSTGVRPAVAVMEEAGLEVGESGALAVDDHQRCPGHEGVFAAGDCAESRHRLLDRQVNIQLGTHANKQGRIAGVNVTGGDLTFPGVIGTAASKICRYEIARTGLSENEAQTAGIDVVAAGIRDRTRAGYFPGAGPIWVKLVADARDGRLLGGQIVGVEGAAKRIDVLATATWAGMNVQDLELLDLSYAPPFSGVYDPLLIAARQVAKKL
ncbi:MAG TPA: FAD-dependent oxidoreductase [Solirubrobacteraceae bacterium]|nr:FAD-dependent oxidoreductase [Solirubrobacteraceae bacterium]